jgi:ubiquinone biosynthesis accessory factor UbiK
MLVRRAFKVQIPCHRKFQCSFHGLRAEAPSPRTILELRINALRQMGAEHSEVRHMNTPKIDEIVRRLLESVPPGVRAVQKDLESNFRAVLRASLTKLDLVSRDEFDAQMRVLERTRARLEELERRVAAMDGSGAEAAGEGGDAPGGVGGEQTAGVAGGNPGRGGEPGPH